MRTLLLLRGSPASGKTTWIEQNKLKQYTLSSDDIRLLVQSPVLLPNGKIGITQNNDKIVWEMLFDMLQSRMERGEFTVIDATNSKTVEMNRYKELAESYRYRIYCVDFTDVPMEECIKRNNLRPEYKQVSQSAIEKMYSRFATQKIPTGITKINRDELDTILYKPIDLSQYNKIHHIGDLHGCNTVLQEYLKDGLKDDEYYIFLGDYIDRGIENADVLKFLFSIKDKKNVCLLEGNHERALWIYGSDGIAKSSEFEKKTKLQLSNGVFTPKQARMLYRKLGQCAYYSYGDKIVFVSHGGISTINDNLLFIATEQLTKGVGTYEDSSVIAETWYDTTPENYYQIHGHRNLPNDDIMVNDKVFNLEGKVEFGGDLRVVTLSKNGFETFGISNTIFDNEQSNDKVQESIIQNNITVEDAIKQMRNSKFINEKKITNNISSFNFTKDAFYNKEWSDLTTKARGLFINVIENKVVARSYEKFFNINERPNVKIDMLQYKLSFPIRAYVKENGFLGIVSYDKENDDFFIATKSTNQGDFVKYLKDIFETQVKNKEELKQYIKDNNVSFVFECVDINNDPHIIEYKENELFLLDIIYNDLNFKKYSYEELCKISQQFDLKHKTLAYTLDSWQDFYKWYNEVLQEDYLYNNQEIEGFVVEDTNGFMFKIKLWYYNTWKFNRSIAQEVLRSGNFRRTSALTTSLHNLFCGWMKNNYKNEDLPKDIISLRKLFYQDMIKKEI